MPFHTSRYDVYLLFLFYLCFGTYPFFMGQRVLPATSVAVF